jgi:methyltransferase (TIGR00027 family)
MTHPSDTVPGTDGALDPVATTARLTAAARARESARPDRLFTDPFAERLAGDPGQALLRDTGNVDNPTIAVRTRYYDDALAGVVGAGTRQIVLVAAGMDTRAYRLDLPADTVLFELDRPELLRLKDSLLHDATPRGIRRPVGVDLTADWADPLITAGFRPDRAACWVIEGLFQYLAEPDVHRLLDRVTELSPPGGHLLTDVVGRSLLDSPSMRGMLDALAARGMAWVFGTEHPEDLLVPRGWRPEVTRISAAGAASGRWPFPDAPRGTPGVPQGYLVHARR